MELLTPDIGLVAWASLSFLLLLIVLKKFAWTPIVSSLEERNKSIETALSQAQEARNEMAQLVAHNEEVLREAKEERNNILREANKVKEQIIAEAKEKAQEDATRIYNETKAEIEIQKNAVMSDMKNAAALLAVEIAEKVLSKELSAKGEQEKFINELASKATLN